MWEARSLKSHQSTLARIVHRCLAERPLICSWSFCTWNFTNSNVVDQAQFFRSLGNKVRTLRKRAGFKGVVVETATNCSRSLLKLEETCNGYIPIVQPIPTASNHADAGDKDKGRSSYNEIYSPEVVRFATAQICRTE